ncbi:MAG TPA: D-glycero-beta-D-manno-heptose-7-phosphate kinase [Quisquiliibacterium sp.]|nr:D-glycero-beta-D-manno-heptose-7-phosphate kinase [Quisquiliibacterium sp.]HQN12528.1 D-glycero-beta-D-manno-heptose-7-phosphate kinase [Quisquiliibacterium sp.]
MAPIDFSAARILVVGDVMLDRYWFGDVQRISPEAPVPVVRVRRSEERLGGAANVARNAAVLGAHVALVGVVGDDEPGRSIEALARAVGIDCGLVRDPELPTTIKLRVIGRQQQLLRIDFEQAPGAQALARKLEAVRARLADAQVLVLSDYGKGSLSEIELLIADARAAGTDVIVDPKGDDYARYRGVTMLTPNRAELREVVGAWRDEDDLVQRAQALRRSLEIRYLLLTRSEEGMTLFSEAGELHVPAQAREVYDVSGAGDTVVAVIAAMFAAGRPVDDAVRLANRAGGIVVGKLGTAAVSPDELFAA